MKLFEMFDNDAHQGRVNIKKIVEAHRYNTGATILAGTELLVLESKEVKEVYGLYESSLDQGTHDAFVQGLGQLNETTETLEHILSRFPKEVKDFKMGDELADDLYEALFDYYMLHGEMPYGISKARTGDPYEWVTQQLDAHLGGGMQIGMDMDRPAEATSLNALNGIFDSLHEGLDMNLLKGMQGAMKKNAKDPESERNVGKKYGYRSDKVNDDEDNYDEWGNEKPGKKKRVAPASDATEKRGRGRPRTRPEPDANATKRGRGRPRKHALPDANAPKRGRGRPKKVREWIDSLRGIAEGRIEPTATGLKHHANPDNYGGSEKDHDDDRLDKAGTNRRERAMGVKWDREKKWQGGINTGAKK